MMGPSHFQYPISLTTLHLAFQTIGGSKGPPPPSLASWTHRRGACAYHILTSNSTASQVYESDRWNSLDTEAVLGDPVDGTWRSRGPGRQRRSFAAGQGRQRRYELVRMADQDVSLIVRMGTGRSLTSLFRQCATGRPVLREPCPQQLGVSVPHHCVYSHVSSARSRI